MAAPADASALKVRFTAEWVAIAVTVIASAFAGYGGYVTMRDQVTSLEHRIKSLEDSRDSDHALLVGIDQKLALLICKDDPKNCLTTAALPR